MNKTILNPRVKKDFQDQIEAGKDFGSFGFPQLWKMAAFQYHQNRDYYRSITECPMRAVADDLVAHFDALEESHLLAQEAWPTQEDWADYWYNAAIEKLRFLMRGKS